MLWFYFVALTEIPMFGYVLVFAIGVLVGAFSHKWLAAKFTQATGESPQAIADRAKGELKNFKS